MAYSDSLPLDNIQLTRQGISLIPSTSAGVNIIADLEGRNASFHHTSHSSPGGGICPDLFTRNQKQSIIEATEWHEVCVCINGEGVAKPKREVCDEGRNASSSSVSVR